MNNSEEIKISDEIRKENKDLIELILASESMNDVEKQHWINLLPAMEEAQKKDLSKTLEEERSTMEKLKEKFK